MMNRFKEIFDQMKDTFLARWEQFQETETYMAIRERYDNLSPTGQKLAIATSAALIVLILIMTPWGWYSTSRDNITLFEETKLTINQLLEVAQESKAIPAQGQTLTSIDIRSKVDKILSEKGLAKDQITSVQEKNFENPKGSTLIPTAINQSGVEVILKKLNLKQLVDIGYELEKISSAVKVLGVDIQASSDDAHYYNTTFQVASFSVDEVKEATKPKRR